MPRSKKTAAKTKPTVTVPDVAPEAIIELTALTAIVTALEGLPAEAKDRVLSYVTARYTG